MYSVRWRTSYLTVASLVVPGVSFEPHRITTDAQFREAIASAKYSLIISELKNPKYDAVKAFARLRGGQIMTPFIVVPLGAKFFGEDGSPDPTAYRRGIPHLLRQMNSGQFGIMTAT